MVVLHVLYYLKNTTADVYTYVSQTNRLSLKCISFAILILLTSTCKIYRWLEIYLLYC